MTSTSFDEIDYCRMPITNSEELGTLPINKLLIKQSIPASIGVLVMSLNVLVDSIFVDDLSVYTLSLFYRLANQTVFQKYYPCAGISICECRLSYTLPDDQLLLYRTDALVLLRACLVPQPLLLIETV